MTRAALLLLIFATPALASGGRSGLITATGGSRGMGAGSLGVSGVPTSLTAWWDPNSGVTITSGKVSAWVDKVGGLSVANTVAGTRPVMGTIGSAACLVFDGTDLLISSGKLFVGTSGEFWAVFSVTSGSTASQTLVCQDDTNNASFWTSMYAVQASGQMGDSINEPDEGDTDAYYAATTTIASTTTYVARRAATGGSAWSTNGHNSPTGTTSMELNGVSQTITLTHSHVDGSWFGNADIGNQINETTFGAFHGGSVGSEFLTGKLGDMVFVENATLSAGDASALRQLLAHRYGVTLP